MKSLVIKFSYYDLVKECSKQGWKIPTSDEVKNSNVDHDVIWVGDPPPHDEDPDRAYLYVKSKNKLELCNKSFMHYCVVIKMPCIWDRVFDGHFNISCVNQTGERANGNFKPDNRICTTTWNFKYCPYCGKEIRVKDN